MEKKEWLRQIPKVDDLLEHEKLKKELNQGSRKIVVEAIRDVIEILRKSILSGKASDLFGNGEIKLDLLVEKINDVIKNKQKMSLRKVINGTGTILHTNLGRAVISEAVMKKAVEIASNYSTLEYDLEEGERGSRYSHVEKIIIQLTGMEAAMVVNNNAAAVMLILNTLAKNKEVVVSRGELVEIGGSFRIPEIMEQSGAELKEVGTTNKTHLSDYENAINEETGALLKVHTSNYKILGFVEEVELEAMVDLGERYNVPVIHDLGSGALIDLEHYGIYDEPTVMQSVSAGADIICFSGDKLLGGPQAGIIIGKKEWIQQMKKNPLARVFRMDKVSLAMLEATLKIYQTDEIINKIPTLEMMTMSKDEMRLKAEKLYEGLKVCEQIEMELVEGFSQVGGGSLPLHKIAGWMVQIKPKNGTVNEFEKALRHQTIPIIVRIYKEAILIDVRTIKENEFSYIIHSIQTVGVS